MTGQTVRAGFGHPPFHVGPVIVASVATLVAAGVALGIVPSATSGEARPVLAITILGLGLWGAFPRHMFWPSVLVAGLLLVSRAAVAPAELPGQVVALYGGSGVWTPLTGFLLAHALTVSGLGGRLARGMVRRIGRKPSLVVLAVGIASLVVAPLSPSTTAKAFMLVPVCVGLAAAFQARPGTRFGAAIFLMAAAANNIGASMFLTATIPNFISAQYLATVGFETTWLKWLVMAGPPNLLLIAAAWLVLLVTRGPDVDVARDVATGRSALAEAHTAMRRPEIATAAAVAVAVVAWITEPVTGFNGGFIGLAVAAALFLPPVGVLSVRRIGEAVPWGPVSLFFAALLLGSSISATAVFDPIVGGVFAALGVHELPLLPAVAAVTLVALFGHLVFTSTTAYATVVVPIALAVAGAAGLPPVALALPVAITMGYAFMLPMNTVPNVIMLETGYFTARQMFLYGTAVTLAAAVILVGVALPYWQWLGVLGS
jgi:anion transporter